MEESERIPAEFFLVAPEKKRGKYLMKLYVKSVLKKININNFWLSLSGTKPTVKLPKHVTAKATWILDLI